MEPSSHVPLPVKAVAPVTSQQEFEADKAAAAWKVEVGRGGRERCPRCASGDTKFCYYNNYNTAQPRHFCRACRRHWTLGGSLRNVPVGGAVRKRVRRPARPTRALAAAITFASRAPSTVTAQNGLFESLPMLELGRAPLLLEGRLGGALGQAGNGEVPAPFDFGAAPLLWPASMVLEGDLQADTTWKAAAAGVSPSTAPVWQAMELAAAVEAGGSRLYGVGHPQRL